MNNSYCQEEYCNLETSEKKNYSGLFVFGGFVAFVLLISALIVYGTLQGYYVDPSVLY